MTVNLKVEAEIRRLYFAEHWKQGTIASELGVHFDTVVRVLGSFGPKAGSPRPEARVLETYIPFVNETLARYPRLVSTRIRDMLVERGYTGSLRTLRRYVLNARPAPKSEVFLRVETLPGEQAQVERAHVGSLVILGSTRPLWAFVMVLAYSRAMWGELVLDMSAESLRRSLVRASAFFGGSPRQWLFDNPKTVVLERSGDAVRFHPALLDLSARMHVQPALCGVRKPHEKGKVERAIRYLKDRFFRRARPLGRARQRAAPRLLRQNRGPTAAPEVARATASPRSSRRRDRAFSLCLRPCPRSTRSSRSRPTRPPS